MVEDIFLARTEEQQQFQRTLGAMLPKGFRKHLPTVAKLLPQQATEARSSILLFYGEGGMGKTSLMRRILKIATEDKAFKGQVNTLSLNWEDEKKLTLELKVGHDFIEPETVLKVLHQALVKAGWGNYFGEFEKTLKALHSAESKVEDALRQQPGSDLPDKLSKLGAKGLALFIRAQPGAGTISQETLETTLDTTLQVGAEGLYQARRFVQKALSQKEYEIYEQPPIRLADALAKGLTRLAERKPLVLLLDTYEIVDRPDCDYTLRRVIRETRETVIWVIAGRSNLADSGRRGKIYFDGYRQQFDETILYAKALSEFSLDLIQKYFAQVIPECLLSEAEAKAVTQFSLGIPFVIRQTAVMYREGKPLAEIVAPVETSLGNDHSAYNQVVKKTSERFLMHCFNAEEETQDLQAIYALALMRRPNAELLRDMLNGTNLESRLHTLRERYSFILTEQLRLDEKLNRFLQEYLLNPLRRTSDLVQRLNDNAIAWLTLQLEQKTNGITDTADQLKDEDIAELRLDLAHHFFWQSEDDGWRYLVPRFLEGWQYRRTWVRSLLEIADSFTQSFGKENQKRLSQFKAVLTDLPDTQTVQFVLDDLNALEKRGWLDDSPSELKAMHLVKMAELAYGLEQQEEALKFCHQAERQVPETALQLKKNIANIFNQVGWKFFLINRFAVPSVEGREALLKASKLDPNDGTHLIGLGVAQYGLKQYQQAVESLSAGIDMEGEESYSLNWLGNVYSDMKRYEEAIAAYEKAIALDETFAYPHNGLGSVYFDLKRYEEAIAAYEKAIALDETYATPHNGLGSVYCDLKRYEEAIAAYEKAIALDETSDLPYTGLADVFRTQGDYRRAIDCLQMAYERDQSDANRIIDQNKLGNVYRDLKRYEEAIAAYEKAIALDETYTSPHNGLGIVYRAMKRYEEAIAAYEKAIALDETYTSPHNGLGNVYRELKCYEEAIAAYEKAIALDETDAYPHNGLGNVYRELKRYEEAIAAYQKVGELEPNSAYSKTEIGLTYALQNQLDDAHSAWKDALSLFEDENWDKLHKALYTLALGESELGLQHLEMLLETGVEAEAIKAVLIDADLLTQCPAPPACIDDFINKLRAELQIL